MASATPGSVWFWAAVAPTWARTAARHDKKRQQREPGNVSGVPEVIVEHPVGVTPEPAVVQVHQQKGEVVPDVADGETVVEFDSIEDHRAPADQADVAQMQIAVQVTHESVFSAPLEKVHVPRQCGLGKRDQIIGLGRFENAGLEGLHGRRIDIEHALHGFRAAEVVSRLGTGMKIGNYFGQVVHVGQRQGMAPGKTIEQRPLVEPVHCHHPIDGRTGPVQRQRTVRAPRHRDNSAIDLRGGAPVDRDLGLAHCAAARGRRVVQEVEVNCALELVGAITGQENDGAVGVDAFDGGSTVGRGIGKEGFDLGLIFDDHRERGPLPTAAPMVDSMEGLPLFQNAFGVLMNDDFGAGKGLADVGLNLIGNFVRMDQRYLGCQFEVQLNERIGPRFARAQIVQIDHLGMSQRDGFDLFPHLVRKFPIHEGIKSNPQYPPGAVHDDR